MWPSRHGGPLTPEQMAALNASMYGQAPSPPVQQVGFPPPHHDPRVGYVQSLQKEHYDTVLYGRGQTFNENGEEFFTNNDRLGNEFLCSLKERGKFSDKKEFMAHGVGLTVDFQNPDQYELLHYMLITYEAQEAKKFKVWADRLAAGGGVFGQGGSETCHLNWGAPDVNNLYWLSEPWEFGQDRTFKMVAKFMNNLAGIAPEQQPRTLLNSDRESRKLLRLFMVGEEIGDITNR